MLPLFFRIIFWLPLLPFNERSPVCFVGRPCVAYLSPSLRWRPRWTTGSHQSPSVKRRLGSYQEAIQKFNRQPDFRHCRLFPPTLAKYTVQKWWINSFNTQYNGWKYFFEGIILYQESCQSVRFFIVALTRIRYPKCLPGQQLTQNMRICSAVLRVHKTLPMDAGSWRS